MVAEITVDSRDLRKLKRELQAIPNGVARAFSRAINKTLVFARTRVVNMIAKTITLRKGDIKSRNIFLKRASFTKPFGRLRRTAGKISRQADQEGRVVQYYQRQTKGYLVGLYHVDGERASRSVPANGTYEDQP